MRTTHNGTTHNGTTHNGTHNVIKLPGIRELPRRAPMSVRSQTEAVILTQDATSSWLAPPFQRPLCVNAKVQQLAELMKTNGAEMPGGALTLGVLGNDRYLVDGQHRIEAFKISGLPEIYCELRMCHFENMGSMAMEFVTLNSKLTGMRPDDMLRGLEQSTPSLQALRAACSFVGYGMIRRGTATPIVSMSVVLRSWAGAAQDVPSSPSTSAATLAMSLAVDDAGRLATFLNTAHGAWGRDAEYFRLWGSLNLALNMWLWRRLVLKQYSGKALPMSAAQFAKCMMSLSASTEYVDWLVGRGLTERDRGPAFTRIRRLFIARQEQDTGKRPTFMTPAWYQGGGSSR